MTTPLLTAQLYTVRQHTQTLSEFTTSIEKIAAIGYQAVQIATLGPIPQQDVKQIISDNGLKICSSHTLLENLQADLDAVIAQHKLWDCQHLSIAIMPAAYREAGEDGFQRFAAEINALGETLYKAGLKLSYHNHSFELAHFNGRTGLDLIFEETDPRYIQAELDTYWIQQGGGDPAEWIRKLRWRLPSVHLKDMLIAHPDGAEQKMAPVGGGNMNWPSVLEACRDAEVEFYIVEQDHSYNRDPFDCLAESYKNLMALNWAEG